jgi:hypothetical protein
MKRILTIALIAAFVLPAMLTAGVTVTSPTSNDMWPIFSTQTIEWEVTGDNPDCFSLYWSENIDNPPVWYHIADVDGDVREYDWQVTCPIPTPPAVPNCDALVQVVACFCECLQKDDSDEFCIIP